MSAQSARPLWVVVFVTTVLAARTARADDPTAEQLYQEGRRAAQAKDYALACAKFRASEVREPAPGTRLNLADCEEQLGMLGEAHSHFEGAAYLFSRAPRGEPRAAYARERAAAVLRRIPSVRLTVRGAPSASVRVILDDGAVDATRLGDLLPLDPGEHQVLVRAAGHLDARSTFRLAEGELREIELAPGGPEPAAPARERRASVIAPLATPEATPSLVGAWVSLGVGTTGVVVALVGGLLTLNAKNTAGQHCPAIGCDAVGLDAESRGKTWSTVATAASIVGGAGLALGAGLLLFGPSGSKAVVAARPVAGGAALSFLADL